MYRAIKNVGMSGFCVVWDNFQKGFTQKVTVRRDADMFKVMTDMGFAHFENAFCCSRRVVSDCLQSVRLIPASARKGSSGSTDFRGFMFSDELEQWLAQAAGSQSFIEDFYDFEKYGAGNPYKASSRDGWITLNGKADHSERVWIHMSKEKYAWTPVACFGKDPDDATESANILIWLTKCMEAVHGKDHPIAILCKGDYTIYTLIRNSIFGDTTGVLDPICPLLVDHWHPVKGALGSLCGLNSSKSRSPVRRFVTHFLRHASNPWQTIVDCHMQRLSPPENSTSKCTKTRSIFWIPARCHHVAHRIITSDRGHSLSRKAG